MTTKSTAMTTPVRQTPPSTGGGRGPAPDIQAAWDAMLPHRDEWFLVANQVPNPNRYFDAFKALGGRVKQAKVEGGTDIYVLIPAGPLVPHRKPSQAKKETLPAVQTPAKRTRRAA